MRSSIEDIIPGLREARSRESLNRAIAFAGLGHTLCGEEVRPLTPGDRLKLQLLGNAFADPRLAPLEGDVFQFLWVLSPRWLPLTGWARFASEWRQSGLRRRVRRLNLAAANRECFEYLATQLQDMPERETGEDNHGAWVHWVAQDATFWINIHGGFTLETYLATPFLVLQGLHRAWKVNHPDSVVGADGKLTTLEPGFINASDRLISAWHLQHRAAAAAVIRAQRFRIDS